MTLYELCQKDVVDVIHGSNLGRVDDIVFEEQNASISHFVLYGRLKLFGLLGKEEDTILPWDCIRKIGEDVLLIELPKETPPHHTKKTILK